MKKLFVIGLGLMTLTSTSVYAQDAEEGSPGCARILMRSLNDASSRITDLENQVLELQKIVSKSKSLRNRMKIRKIGKSFANDSAMVSEVTTTFVQDATVCARMGALTLKDKEIILEKGAAITARANKLWIESKDLIAAIDEKY
jgi:hypothetical protein